MKVTLALTFHATQGECLIFNSNIWNNWAPFRDIRLQNVSDPDFDLSRSFKVKRDGAIELSIYNFLLLFDSYIWLN